MMNKIRLTACVLLATILISCEPFDPCAAWVISNKLNSGITVYTTVENDEEIIQCSYIPPAYIKPNKTKEVFTTSYNTQIYREIESQMDQMTLYFSIEGLKCNDSSLGIEKSAVAYFKPEYEWLLEYSNNIYFPNDCIVNPDLWKLYDLDKFVEQYGPLNATGWDEVWYKWQESKRKNK